MTLSNSILSELISLSHILGDPSLDYAILGEGNTSARIDQRTFWVKASGSELRTIDESGFVQVDFKSCLETLAGPDMDDERSLCGEEYSPSDVTYTCSKDGGNLDVALDYESIRSKYKPERHSLPA